MSAHFTPVGWNRSKIVYDVVLLVAVAGFLVVFQKVAGSNVPTGGAADPNSIVIRMYADCAFVLLTIALSIGPLARLDSRFLPLLYNRRHLGVVTFAIAAAHAQAVFGWYFSFSTLDPWVAMIASDSGFGTARAFPYVPFGAGALLILAVLAFTSHDFWLRFLGSGLWKTLHVGLYVAYVFVVAHLSFGALQSAQTAALPVLVGASATLVLGLHIAAGLVETRRRRAQAGRSAAALVEVCAPADIPDGKARIVRRPAHEAIAVFRRGDSFYALGHRCSHQGGPLGEGRVSGECIICPWHGFEYRLIDGCAPPPYAERVPTYRVELRDGTLWVDTTPRPLGTQTPPLVIGEQVA